MTDEGREAPTGVSRGELLPADPPGSMQEWAERLVARARDEGVGLTGEGGLLTDLMRHVLQTGLEVELTEHLGYAPHERGRGAGNARNGPCRSAYREASIAEAVRVCGFPCHLARDRPKPAEWARLDSNDGHGSLGRTWSSGGDSLCSVAEAISLIDACRIACRRRVAPTGLATESPRFRGLSQSG
jgi:hypothetical protein